MNIVENKLLNSGKPLFFQVENALEIGIKRPEYRLGEDLQTVVKSLTVFQKEAVVTSNRTGKTWRLSSDEGAYLNGTNYAPAPLCHLTVGMISSYMNEILALARIRSIEINNILLIQDNYYSMQGSMISGTMSAQAYDVHLEAQIESSSSLETLKALVIDATSASPLNDLMQREHQSLFKLNHNGKELKPQRVREINGSINNDLTFSVELVKPSLQDWNSLCIKSGMTPKHKNSVSEAGSSLSNKQDRLIHLRGSCRLRPDGVKEITQYLFNPNGSIFTLLSDEGPENGGKGRAPDAATYISAGIGFCFMTQFGRYAKMKKSKLKEYQIIQNSYFSPGGASGGTGKRGKADALETHVFLESNEDDNFAKKILDISEQTCFLHALCRANLKTKITVTNYENSL